MSIIKLKPAAFFLSLLLLAGECIAQSNLTLSGRFEHRTDPESLDMYQNLVCFYPSPESAKLLPRPENDGRLAWFCFKNDEASKTLLGIPQKEVKNSCGYEGEAIVQVEKYAAYLGEGDGFDVALLQSASNISELKSLPCE